MWTLALGSPFPLSSKSLKPTFDGVYHRYGEAHGRESPVSRSKVVTLQRGLGHESPTSAAAKTLRHQCHLAGDRYHMEKMSPLQGLSLQV